MNIKNINSAIAIMTRHMEAQLPLDMTTWQSDLGGDSDATLKEEDLCGTPCCMAGYIAVSPEFQADGGKCRFSGAPHYNDLNDDDAIREWFGCSTKQADSLCDIQQPKYAYPDVAFGSYFGSDIKFPDVIAALVSLRDTGLLPGE